MELTQSLCDKKNDLVVFVCFKYMKVPVWKNNSRLLVCRPYRQSGCQLIVSHLRKTLTRKMHRVRFGDTNKHGGGACMSVSEKEVKSQTAPSVHQHADKILYAAGV